jgi:hypothetical protein
VRRSVVLSLCVASLAAAALVARAGFAGDDLEELRGEIVRASQANDAARVVRALDRVASMVGPEKAFADVGAAADWVAALPDGVTGRPVVQVRLGWMYVTGLRGPDALPHLEKALRAAPSDARARAYFAEAKRQAGEPAAAAGELARAIGDGVPDDLAEWGVTKLVAGLLTYGKKGEGTALPEYASAAETVFAAKDFPAVRRSVALRLSFDAEEERVDAERSTALRTAAVRHAWAYLRRAPADGESARLSYEASRWVAALGDARPSGLPERFDLLAAAVRMGETSDPEAHQVPEALAAMAEEALAKGRFVLAERMARRRLAMSDSPAARRVLLRVPADVGD